MIWVRHRSTPPLALPNQSKEMHMRTAPLVALALTIAAMGAATAQELATVEVRAEEGKASMTLSCKEPNNPSLKEVDRVLMINDPAESASARTRLLEIASEACAQNQAKIQVS